MSGKHTPGPWRYVSTSRDIRSPCIVSKHIDRVTGEETLVVNLSGAMGGDDTRADARLIAAAPEMLEALRMLIAPDGCVPDCFRRTHEALPHDLGCDLARAAIRKAVGDE